MYLNFRDYDESLLSRPSDDSDDIVRAVEDVLENVRKRGDAALFEYAERFDSSRLNSLYVSDEEFEKAEALVPDSLKAAIDHAMRNIRTFHQAQLPAGEDVVTEAGVRCWRRIVPIRRVGLYIPGGTAPLFSTVLMLAVPAVVAGCSDIILATPARNGVISPAVLYAASAAGVRRVLKVGGAQAIAAFAYGTESVEKRDKIFGPGNRYVTEAKRIVSSSVAIDMPAGPSEVMVVIDRSSDPAFAAADLLSQAEHDVRSTAVLVTDSRPLAEAVQREVERQLADLPRQSVARRAIEDNGKILVTRDLKEAAAAADRIAPEHLELCVEDPFALLPLIHNAGSVFLGRYAPEALGTTSRGPTTPCPRPALPASPVP